MVVRNAADIPVRLIPLSRRHGNLSILRNPEVIAFPWIQGISYQVALIEVRKAIVGAHLRVRPPVGGHIGPPLQKKKINYLYERNSGISGKAASIRFRQHEKAVHKGDQQETARMARSVQAGNSGMPKPSTQPF